MNKKKEISANPDIQETLKSQRAFFATGKTKDIKFRKGQLKKLRFAIIEHEQDIYDALYADFRKPPYSDFGIKILKMFMG